MDFLSVCYHYVRKTNNEFPRILGTNIENFETDVKMLKEKYNMISLDDVMKSYHNKNNVKYSKKGMLITFDDGLSDHFEASKILYENDVKGVFFIPTCILTEKLPASPTIIHYCLAEFGIQEFLKIYNESLEIFELQNGKFLLNFQNNQDDPWETMKKIKLMFKYNLESNVSRKILIKIYKELFLKKYSNALEIMHLTEDKIKKMLDMGHHIGVHTHSHISIGPTKLSIEDKKIELEEPKNILEKKFKTEINSFSYPFGEYKDCVKLSELPKELKQYKLIFTVEEKINSINTSPFELGRYQPHSSDTTETLKIKLDSIGKGQ